MSIKSTVCAGPNFHLYHKMHNEEFIYLQLEKVEFEAYPDELTVAIPIVTWEVIRNCTSIDLSLVKLRDEELRERTLNQVTSTIEECNEIETGKAKQSLSIFCQPGISQSEQVQKLVAEYQAAQE